MKNMIMILAILTFSLPSFGTPIACGDYFFEIESDFNKLFNTKCNSDDGEEKYCSCIGEERDKNILIQSIDPKLTLKEYQQNNFKENRAKLLDIYNNLNFEVSSQEHKFFMNRADEGLVGCTPQDMASEFNKSLESEKRKEIESIPKKVLNTGRLNIDDLSKEERAILAKDINNKAGFSVYTAPVIKKEDIPSIIPNVFKFANVNNKGDLTILGSNLGAAAKMCAFDSTSAKGMGTELKKTLNEAKEFFTKYPELFVTTDLAELKILLGSEGCEMPMALIEQINNEYLAKIQFSKKYFEAADHRPVAERVAAISFTEENLQLQNKFKKDMTETPANGCLDYNEYKTFNSAPSDLLISEIGKKTEPEILELLDPKNLKSSSQLTDFLKKNPVIAKNTINPTQRAAVAKAMGGLLGKIKGIKDPNDRFAHYSDFMKNDVASINKQDKMMDFLQCDLLARNYAALASSDELPALGIIEGQNAVSNIANQYMACKVRAENEKSPNKLGINPSLKELVAANDLFSLFDSEPKSPEKDDGYMDFLAVSCPGFEQFVEQDLKCMPWMTKATCRKRALNAEETKHGRMRDRYFAKNPGAINAKKIRDLVAKHTQKLDTAEMGKKTNKKYQNKHARKVYEEKAQPILANRSIYSTDNIFRPSASSTSSGTQDKVAGNSSNGSAGSVFETINNAQDNYVATSPVTSGAGRSIASTDTAGGASTPTINPSSNQIQNNAVNSGQQLPLYSGVVPPAALEKQQANKEIEKLIPDFAAKSDEDKVESLEDLAEENSALIEKLKLNEKIESIKEKIANLEPEQESKIVSKNSSKPREMNFSTNTNSVNSGLANGNVSKSGSSSNSGTVFGKGNGISKSTSHGAVNDAIIEKHKNAAGTDSEISPTRSTASIGSLVVGSNTVVDFTMGTVDPSALVVTGAELPLTPESAADYDKIYNDVEALKKFLVKNLEGKTIDSRVVRIKDPVAKPEKFVLFLVSSGNSGHLNVKTINRSATFKGLTNTINNETKSN